MSTAEDLFILATRKAYRFPSVRGDLTIEQLWDLPLLARNNFDLDSVARAVNFGLRALGEESFVEKADTQKTDASAKLEVVKFIIATKQAEEKASVMRAERALERRKILDAIATKEERELSSASKDDLLKQLEELDTAG